MPRPGRSSCLVVLVLLCVTAGLAAPVSAASLPLTGTFSFNSLTNEGSGFLSGVGDVQLTTNGIVAANGDGFPAWFYSLSVFPNGDATGTVQIFSGTGRYARWSAQAVATGVFDAVTHEVTLKL